MLRENYTIQYERRV